MDYKEYDKKPKKRTHAEVFFRGLSASGKSLFLMGFFLALSLVAVITFRFLVVLHETEMNLAVKEGILSAEEAFYSVNSLGNMFYIACFVLIIPAALVMAGICKVLKCLAWGEKSSFKENFGEGMKENFFSSTVITLINVAFLWGISFIRNANPEDPLWSYLPGAVYLLMLLPWSMWFLAASAIYKGGLTLTLKNAFVLTIKTYPFTMVMIFFATAPLLLLLLSNIYLQLAVPFLFAFYVPFVWFAWVLFTNVFFDKYINIRLFPELVDRGLE